MTDPTPATAGTPGSAAEAEAWAAVRAAWDDPLAHRAYLDRCRDLAALARAGARYREALAGRPDDPVAAAGRDEVLRRATLLGLAAGPRTPPRESSRRVKPALLTAAAVVLAVAGIAALALLRSLLGAR